jgi:uncharacterized membrane protein
MSKRGMFTFFVGLIVVMLGVGGIEHSITDSELLNAGAIAVVGLLIARLPNTDSGKILFCVCTCC